MSARIKVFLTIVILTIGISLPYILAARSAGEGYVFGGFLVNPLDGNSYLAKMQQGLAGQWEFSLTYSPQGGGGAYIFLFYIFLGHLAGWTGLPLLLVFHLARLLASIGLLVVLWRFFRWLAKDDLDLAWKMFLLAAIGSGLGWLAAIFTGYLSGDFWIAETFPFLSMYTNPHFPLGLALMLSACLLVFNRSVRYRLLLAALVSVALAVVQPFGVVVLVLPLAGYFLFHPERLRTSDLPAVLLAVAPRGPDLIYPYLAITADPILSLWNAQNLTASPPAWDLALSLSPALLLAAVGGYWALKVPNQRMNLLSFWLVAGVLLVFVPFSLQRRFMSGMYIPVAGLAGYAIYRLASRHVRMKWIWPATLAFSLLTNLLLIAGGVGAAARQDPALYLTRGESAALAWLEGNTPLRSVILASPDIGVYIPAWSGRSVVYGHPFESIHAQKAREDVEAYFSGAMSDAQAREFFADQGIAYVFRGPREEALGVPRNLSELAPVFEEGDVTIYEVNR